MSSSTPLVPPLQIDATSYEARDVEAAPGPDVGAPQIESAPAQPAIDRSTTPALVPESPQPQVRSAQVSQRRVRRSSRARALIARLTQRHNEFWELILGPYAGSGWGGSLLIHIAALTALALCLVTPERKEPPLIITGSTELEGDANIGDSIEDIEVEAQAVSQESSAQLLATGGSSGGLQPDFSSAFGPPSGSGSGAGRGEGDAVGDEIAGRVKAAGGKGGNLQISLGWNDRNDLDLHVVTPTGQRVFYATPKSRDGGQLDVDMNVQGETTSPVENITWGENTPSDGQYLVQVHFFAKHSRSSKSEFSVRVQIGDDIRVVSGTASPGRLTQVATFDIQESRCVALDVNITQRDEQEAQLATAGDTKRAENRERFAAEALAEAQAADDPKLKAGKLRQVIRRFPGTDAAKEAEQILESLIF